MSKIDLNTTALQALLAKAEALPDANAGYTEGQQAAYDAFWDEYQSQGLIYSAQYMFAFGGWNDNTFKPKYSLTLITNASNMFNTTHISDLKAALLKQGVVFDFAKCTAATNAFAYSQLTVLPEINLSGVTNFNQVFIASDKLHTIEKLIINSSKSPTFNVAFNSCFALENIVMEGLIGANGLNFQWSTKLSHDSIVSIIGCLSTATSGLSITFSLAAVNAAFETASGAADGSTSEAWLNLIATRSNWTISLV